jgi:DNA-binding transcriptional ArsR family regulator
MFRPMSADDRCDLLCLDLPLAEALRARNHDRQMDIARAAALATALADPTRLSLAAALAEAEELCVCDLAWIAGRAQNLVSHHLRALRSHGLVESRRAGKMVMYSLTGQGRALLDAVLPARVTA